MSAMTSWFQDRMLDGLFRGYALSLPDTLHVALLRDPETEVEGIGYTRALIPRSARAWACPSAGVTANAMEIRFANPAAEWGTVTHFALFDAPTGGNMLFLGQLNTPCAPAEGRDMAFLSGDLSYQIDA